MQKNHWWQILIILIAAFIVSNVLITEKGIGFGRSASVTLSEDERQWLEYHGPLIYAADNNAPPLRFVDPADGQYKGVVVDYMNLLSLQLRTPIEMHPLLWEDALSQLSSGNTDLCDMFSSEEREKNFVFTQSIYNLRGVVVSKDARIELGDLAELRFATQEGDFVNEYLLNAYPGIQIITVSDVSSALDLLLEDKVDAVAGDEPVILYQINEKNANHDLHIASQVLYDNEVVLGIPKSKKELVPIINKGIAALAKTEQLERIQQKWFGISTPIVQTPDYILTLRLMVVLISAIGTVLISMTLWNKSLKKEVDKRTSELINSKNDLQITFDGMAEYIALIDLDLNVININQSFVDFLNIKRAEALQYPVGTILESFDYAAVDEMIKYALATGKSITRELVKSNHYYLVRIYPLRNAEGEMKNLLMVIQNMTKERISENQMLQANKMAAIGQLAAGMAHEIRNPLGIIRNQSFIIESRIEDDRSVRSFELINNAVERASRIIDNLLEFSRLTNNEKKTINVKDLTSKIMALENKTMLKRKIKLEMSCPQELEIASNAESLRHILINLISNAIDAIGEDGTIRVQVVDDQEMVRIQVIDSGCGIAEDEAQNIFNPFYTTKSVGAGTGLGLYIAYNEAKKLGGSLTLGKSEDAWTMFEISIPK